MRVMSMNQFMAAFGLVLVAAAIAACSGEAGDSGAPGAPGDSGAPGEPGEPGITVAVSPGTAQVRVGESATLMAMSTLAEEDTFAWLSSNTDVATVDDAGSVTGVAEGTVIVAATGATSGSTGLAGVSVIAATPGPVSFATDLEPLFTKDGVWVVGSAACNAAGCHTGVGGAHDLDMGTYEGVILGADAGDEPILDMADAAESPLRKRLRNNRMPWGIPPVAPRNGPPVSSVASELGWVDDSSAIDENGLVKLVEAWINSDAPDGAFDYVDSTMATVPKTFEDDILPLFTTPNVWWPNTEACNSAGCHNGLGGAHGLQMGDYAGIMAGADGGTEPILVPGDAEESPLRARLRNNRMPWGMPTWVPRDGPNDEVLKIVSWIEDGAPNN